MGERLQVLSVLEMKLMEKRYFGMLPYIKIKDILHQLNGGISD